MANTLITPTIIMRESLMHLTNNMVMANLVDRRYEDQFADAAYNGNKVGDTITIDRGVQFTVRDGPVVSNQDVVHGKETFVIDQQKGVDFSFTSKDMTLSVSRFNEKYVEPAMIQLANQVDADLCSLYTEFPMWVGTPGQLIDSFSDFDKGVERMDTAAIPTALRRAVLSSADKHGIQRSLANQYQSPGIVEDALRRGFVGQLSGVDTYMDQNIKRHTVGALGGTPLVDGAAQTTTYAVAKDTMTQTLLLKGATASVTGWAKKGDVFTIGTGATGVFMVNPVSKDVTDVLQEFVVTADAASTAGGAVTLTISPPIIISGAYQTVSNTLSDGAAITFKGTAATGYNQNLLFHKNAIALAVVPMQKPTAAPWTVRESYKGISARLIPIYDGTNDVERWRFDILYGRKVVDRRMGLRLSGSS